MILTYEAALASAAERAKRQAPVKSQPHVKAAETRKAKWRAEVLAKCAELRAT